MKWNRDSCSIVVIQKVTKYNDTWYSVMDFVTVWLQQQGLILKHMFIATFIMFYQQCVM